jgi:hypothetical protein
VKSTLRGEGGQVGGILKGEGCEMHKCLNRVGCGQLESRLEIERLTSGLEEGCWKSAWLSNSLAAYPTARPVWRGE